jgi:glycosyltransferase involved in cell wall biosynthesis
MNSTQTPLITLIIPTRERCETLRFTLQSAVEQRSANFEIIVCDNFSQDGTRQVVDAVTDPRVRYVNPGKRLSMCDNWDFALQFARGAYVIFIGDDDAVMPGGIDRLATLIGECPRDSYMWRTSTYVWPIDGRKATVEYLSEAQPAHEMDLRQLAAFVIAHGGWKYYRIPGSYHAAVSRRIFDRIRETTGRVFHTTQPDLFTSMAIPVFAQTCMNTGQAITVQGRSAKSNAGASVARDGPAVQARFIAEYGDYKIHPTLFPNAPAMANLILDAILVAKDTFPAFYGSMHFNYEAMWAFMCRLKLLSGWDVLRQRTAIRQYHRFRTSRFLLYLFIQDAAALRRRVLSTLVRRRTEGSAPDNILAFAKLLSIAPK